MKSYRASELLKQYHRKEIDVQQLFNEANAIRTKQLRAQADRIDAVWETIDQEAE